MESADDILEELGMARPGAEGGRGVRQTHPGVPDAREPSDLDAISERTGLSADLASGASCSSSNCTAPWFASAAAGSSVLDSSC